MFFLDNGFQVTSSDVANSSFQNSLFEQKQQVFFFLFCFSIRPWKERKKKEKTKFRKEKK